MAENENILQKLSGVVKAVFLICLAALIPIAVAEWYSGQNTPQQTVYDILEKILVGAIVACIFMWLVAEAWREIRFHRDKFR